MQTGVIAVMGATGNTGKKIAEAAPAPTKQAALRNQPSRFTAWRLFVSSATAPEIARVLVRFDHFTSRKRGQ